VFYYCNRKQTYTSLIFRHFLRTETPECNYENQEIEHWHNNWQPIFYFEDEHLTKNSYCGKLSFVQLLLWLKSSNLQCSRSKPLSCPSSSVPSASLQLCELLSIVPTNLPLFYKVLMLAGISFFCLPPKTLLVQGRWDRTLLYLGY
jgi:hypothetical protein